VHTVGFPSFSHAGEQGSAKNPPKGSGSFADLLCRGCPSKSQGKKPPPTKNFERNVKTRTLHNSKGAAPKNVIRAVS